MASAAIQGFSQSSSLADERVSLMRIKFLRLLDGKSATKKAAQSQPRRLTITIKVESI